MWAYLGGWFIKGREQPTSGPGSHALFRSNISEFCLDSASFLTLLGPGEWLAMNSSVTKWTLFFSFLFFWNYLKIVGLSNSFHRSFMHNPGRGLPFTGSQRSLQDLQFNPCNLSPRSSGFSFYLVLHWRIRCATMIRAWKYNSQPHSASISPSLPDVFPTPPSVSHGCSLVPGGIFCLVPMQDPAIWYQGWSQEQLRHGPWGKESS